MRSAAAREKVVPLDVPRRATSVDRPPHDVSRGPRRAAGRFRVVLRARAGHHAAAARPNEGRSDIFFLEVRPYEQEFALAQSQSMAGAGYSGSIDDLVNAQKQVVVATWKLDRRGARAASGARGRQQDIRAIGRSEAELKTRAEETASSLRESTMRDPRRRLAGTGQRTRRWAAGRADDARGRRDDEGGGGDGSRRDCAGRGRHRLGAAA